MTVLECIGAFLFALMCFENTESTGKCIAWGVALIVWVFIFESYKKARKKQKEEAAKKSATVKEAPKPTVQEVDGRYYVKVAGVTFHNDDGTKRQTILRKAMREDCDGEVTLEKSQYKDEDSIKVLYDCKCIGFVPRGDVQNVLELMPYIRNTRLHVKEYEVEEDLSGDEEFSSKAKVISAHLYMYYNK